MRALIATILTTLVVVTLAAPASAGIPSEAYDQFRESEFGEATCLVVNEFVDGWYEHGGAPIPALRQLQNRVAGCDDSGSEAVKLVDRLIPDVPDTGLEPGENMRESVPAQGHEAYDLATVFPCAFSAAFVMETENGQDNPLHDPLIGFYKWAGCADNQFLPPEYRL